MPPMLGGGGGGGEAASHSPPVEPPELVDIYMGPNSLWMITIGVDK